MTLAYIPKPRSLQRGLCCVPNPPGSRQKKGAGEAGPERDGVSAVGHALPGSGEPGPGLSDCGGGGGGGIPGRPVGSAARTLHQSPPSRPLPALQQRGSALRSLAPFFSSAIFPLQSIAGNRMWVTQQHCLRLRKLPLLLPKGSGGARGRRCGCRGRGGAGGARGGGRSCSPSHVPEHGGSGRGLSQPPEVSGERGGGPALAVRAPKQRGLGKLHLRVSAAPEAQGQAAGNVRGAGRGCGDAPVPDRVGGDRGGTPTSPEGSLVGAWAHFSRPRRALAGTAAETFRPRVRRVPSAASLRPQRDGAQGTNRLSPTRVRAICSRSTREPPQSLGSLAGSVA